MKQPASIIPELLSNQEQEMKKLWRLRHDKCEAERQKAALETEIARLEAEIEVIMGKVPL